MAKQKPRPWTRRLLPSKRSRWIAAVAVVIAAIGLSVVLAISPSSTSATPVPAAGGRGAAGGGANARSGPAEGGATGAVDSVSTSSFTMVTAAGQKVTVNEASATTYQNATGSIAASAITNGDNVLVLGSTTGTTITAGQVIVQPDDGGGSAASTAAGVVPFQRGAPSAAKQDGQIPQNYTEGSGTIVSATPADQAIRVALAAYPGGVVDRVVQLSTGEYEVHYIGVNWPHHIFVSQDFQFLGAS
jgi:hypothetical protein